MKLTRLSLLLLALVLSVATAPEAFGAKLHRGSLAPMRGRTDSLTADDCYYIYCYGVLTSGCCGTVPDCLDQCDDDCNVDRGTCIYVQ